MKDVHVKALAVVTSLVVTLSVLLGCMVSGDDGHDRVSLTLQTEDTAGVNVNVTDEVGRPISTSLCMGTSPFGRRTRQGR